MNLPNKLTLSRFVFTGLFVGFMASGWGGEGRRSGWLPHWHWAYTAALLVFLICAATDYLDGEIARRRNLITNFGKLMDPLADKVMMASGFICLVPMRAIPAWVAIVIIAREFLITGLRLLAASKGQVLPAEKLGKHKVAWQIITVCYFLLLLSLTELAQAGKLPFASEQMWKYAWDYLGNTLLFIATALTLYSGLGYFWKHRDLVAEMD